MATRVLTPQEYFDRYINAVRSQAGFADFSQGSMLDILGGAFSLAMNELAELMITEFRKTYFVTAEGADLDNLAIDHFGPRFARPAGSPSRASVVFSRPEAGAAVEIPVGTALETVPTPGGVVYTFLTERSVRLRDVDTKIEVSVVSQDTGRLQNVLANTITVIADPLSDPTVTVTNPQLAAGGSDVETDEEFRETIQRLIGASVGATKEAIEGALLAEPTIGFVALLEELETFVPYSLQTEAAVENAPFERIPKAIAYIADSTGQGNAEIVQRARTIIDRTRACGVYIQVIGAVTRRQDVKVAFSGIVGSAILLDPTPIYAEIGEFLKALPIGRGFAPGDIITHIAGIPSLNDQIAPNSFRVLEPAAPVVITLGEKLLPGEITKAV